MISRRILIITNLYPPHYLGGYELGCRDVVEALRKKGNEVRVLTSVFRRDDTADVKEDVDRVLRWEPSPVGMPSLLTLCCRYRNDLRALRTVRREFSPDGILVFNTWGLWQGILDEIQRWPAVCCTHLVSDYALERSLAIDPWLQFWRSQPQNTGKRVLKKWLEAVLRWLGLPVPCSGVFPSRIFTSQFVQNYHVDRGLGGAQNHVIHWGIDLDEFPVGLSKTYQGRLLYSGQLREEKGVHTLVEAIGLLPKDLRDSLQVTLAGGTQDIDFLNRLTARVDALGLTETIRFTGHISREELSGLYATHNVLMFCSEWDEPFSIALLEGMASGLTVIGTTTGGSRELLDDGVNARTYQAGDPVALAEVIRDVHTDPKNAARMASTGTKQVRQSFCIDAMAEQIEKVLHR